MPFALVFIGLVLVITGARGTMRELGSELREDFTGPGNFIWWIVSIGVVGSLGYIPEMRSFSRWFMSLIIVAMVLSNRGFFAKLTEALQAGPENPDVSNANNPDIVRSAYETNVGQEIPMPDNDTSNQSSNNGLPDITGQIGSLGNISLRKTVGDLATPLTVIPGFRDLFSFLK